MSCDTELPSKKSTGAPYHEIDIIAGPSTAASATGLLVDNKASLREKKCASVVPWLVCSTKCVCLCADESIAKVKQLRSMLLLLLMVVVATVGCLATADTCAALSATSWLLLLNNCWPLQSEREWNEWRVYGVRWPVPTDNDDDDHGQTVTVNRY